MIVNIDGKEIKVQNSVEIIHEGVPLPEQLLEPDEERATGNLHIVLNNEGVVLDVFCEGECAASAWQTLDDLLEIVH